MKLFKLVFFLCGIQVFAQQPLFTEAQIEQADVYYNGAELSHRAMVNLPKGNSELVITNIANNVNEKTIQLKVPKGLTVLSVQYSNAYIEEYDDAEDSPIHKELRDRIKAVELELETSKNTLQTKQKAVELLDQAGTDGNRVVQFNTLSQMSQWMAYYQKERTDLQNEVYSLGLEVEKIKRDLENLKARLQMDGGQKGNTGNGKLIVRVMSETTGNFPFSVNYLTPAAQWQPSYELFVEQMNAPIELTYKADISQNTGVDWSETKLRLTSGMIQQNRELPRWNPWFVDYQNNLFTRVQAESLEEVQLQRYDRAPALKANSSSIGEHLTQTENQLNTTFDIDLPYTIISNGKKHSVNLKQLELTGTYTYYSVPRLDRNVYLTAKIPEFGKHQLLPGRAQVIFEGTRIGETQLNPETTDAELSLNLGRDPQIALERTLITDKSGTKFLSTKKEQNFLYKLEIKNNKDRKIKLQLEEQFPLSKDKSIEIGVTQNSGGKIDSEKGIVKWELELKPGESKVLEFGFRIKSDKDKEIGL